jgi:hypothetical protein
VHETKAVVERQFKWIIKQSQEDSCRKISDWFS